MITFKDFLTESRSAPLYHATRFRYLKDIEERGIEPKTLHESSKIGNISDKHKVIKRRHGDAIQGVSLTRDFKFAKRWSDELILELDQRRLSQRYKIAPFQFFQHMGSARVRNNEAEEFVLTSKPIPLSYVKRIIVHPFYLEEKVIKQIQQKYGASFIVSLE